MNANRLLSHFDRVSGAPDAVDRLRRFILDLAVRGKLVEQDEREGNASDLLAQHGVAVEASDEVRPFSVPDSWAWVPVGVVCSKTGSGSTPRGGKTAYVSKGIPFLRSQNVHDDGLTLDDVAYIDAATHSKMIGTAVQPNDLLLNITGGSMGRCCHVPSSFNEGNVSQHVAILRAAIPGTQAFLHKCIISPFFQSLIFDEQTGAGRGGLPKNRMDRLPIPLPPLAEQHRIVEKVDELMKLCDQLEASQMERESRRDRLVVASLNRLSQPTDPDEFKKDAGFQLSNLNRLSTKPEHIKELRKAILNLAVKGKLVPQDPKEEKAEKLLQRIAKKREELVATGHLRNRRSSQKSTTEALHDLPASWTHAFLGVVCQVVQGFAFSSEAFTEDPQQGMPLIRIGDIGADKTQMFVKTESLPEYTVYPGDLLLGLSGSIRSARWNGPPSLLNQRIACIRPIGDELDNRWIDLWLSTYLATLIEKTSKLTVLNVKAAQLYEAPIPLPPLAEQKRIVAKVDELMLICDQLETQLEYQQRGRRQLLEALLHEALEGGWSLKTAEADTTLERSDGS